LGGGGGSGKGLPGRKKKGPFGPPKLKGGSFHVEGDSKDKGVRKIKKKGGKPAHTGRGSCWLGETRHQEERVVT